MSRRRIKRHIKAIKYTGKGCLYFLFSPFILFYYLCKWFFLMFKNGVLFFWSIIKLLLIPFKWITGAAKKNQSGTSIATANDVNTERTHFPVEPQKQFLQEYDPPINTVEPQEQFLQAYDPPTNTPNQTKGNISMVSLINLQCPNCSANLEVDPKLNQCFCQYCGTKILIHNENEQIIRHIDEAKITEVELNYVIKQQQLNDAKAARENELAEIKASHERTKNTQHTMFIVAAVIAIVSFITNFFIGVPVALYLAYYAAKKLPEKENEKRTLQTGGIRFPNSLMPFSKNNYLSAYKTLEAAGFFNITCINKGDLRVDVLQKENRVESITIHGTVAQPGKIYNPGDPIVITYHGR